MGDGRKSSSTDQHSFGAEKTLMPPPEAQESGRVKAEPELVSSSHAGAAEDDGEVESVTVGEHLRQMHGKPAAASSPKKSGNKRPHILQSRRPKPESDDSTSSGLDFADGPAGPLDDATRKSDQVADVVNSVVEKIRRQNETWDGPVKRPAPLQISPQAGPAKQARLEQGPGPAQGRADLPRHLVLAGQPPQRPGMRPAAILVHPPPGQPLFPGQDSLSAPPSSAPRQLHPSPSAAPPKEQPRYLCPECFRT